MKGSYSLIWSGILGVLLWIKGPAPALGLELVKDGKSEWCIVVSKQAIPSEKYAAGELQNFLKQISGANLEIISDQEPMSEEEIIVGDNAHLRQLAKKVNWEINWKSLGEEGFVIRTIEEHSALVIAGGKPRGTLYGVYSLLEDHLGCRWFAPGASDIPRQSTIEVHRLNLQFRPQFEHREVWHSEQYDPDWAARNRVNGQEIPLDEKHGGNYQEVPWRTHSMGAGLVSASKYFSDHPEYFSEINGKRVSDGQLCLSNPDVVRIAVETVREWIKKKPSGNIYWVSQADNSSFCQCKNCKNLYNRFTTYSGAIIQFINQVAEALEKEFPDKLISTFAYQPTRVPPKNIQAHKNIVVYYADISRCMFHPIDGCVVNKGGESLQYLKEWTKIARHVHIYDYDSPYGFFVSPHPTLEAIGPNVKLYQQAGAEGVFVDGHRGYVVVGELAQLRYWLWAKLLWDPNYDVKKGMQEFLKGYYGPSARYINDYINLVHQAKSYPGTTAWWLKEYPGFHMSDDPKMLTPEALKNADRLFDQAEAAVKDNPDLLLRVQVTRLPVYYVMIESLPADSKGRQAAAERFFTIGERIGADRIGSGLLLSDYKKKILGR